MLTGRALAHHPCFPMPAQTVAILESRLGDRLAALLERQGRRVLHAPALAELPDLDAGRIAALVADLQRRPARAAIFQTGVGTTALFHATDALGVTAQLAAALEQAVVVARGPKPTGVLRARGVRIDAVAAEPFTTAQVLDALRDVALDGQRVFVQRYGAANLELDAALQARGAEVIEVPTYRWALPADTQPLVALIEALGRGEVDAVAFTSQEQVRNLFAVAAERGAEGTLRAGLARTLVASIGPVCSDVLRRFDVPIGLEASPPKLGPLVAALDRALA